MARHLFNLQNVKGIHFLTLQCIAEDLGYKIEATAEKGFAYEINCSEEDFDALIVIAKENKK